MIPQEYINDFGFTAVDDPGSAIEEPKEPTSTLLPEIQDIKEHLTILEDHLLTILKLTESKKEINPKDSLDPQLNLQKIERLIMPLLVNLAKDPEKEYILWPKRKEQVEQVIEKLIALTR